METSMFTGFADMDMDDDLSLFDHLLQVNSLEDILGPSSILFPTSCEDNNSQQETTRNINNHDHHSTTTIINEKPIDKQLNNYTNSMNYSYKIIDSPLFSNTTTTTSLQENNNNMLSFSKCSSSSSSQRPILINYKPPQIGNKKGSASALRRSLSQQSKEHILAERRRREKLNQRFISLSAIIPDLNKMDKASVLGDAVKYVKQLEQQVKILEEEAKTKTIESAVLVKRMSMISKDDDDDALVGGSFDCPFPEIEARFSNKDVLIRIHCENDNGVVEKLISQIEEHLHLVVVNSSAFAFGCASLDATIIAQMEEEFSMTAKDLVKHLHAALKRLK